MARDVDQWCPLVNAAQTFWLSNIAPKYFIGRAAVQGCSPWSRLTVLLISEVVWLLVFLLMCCVASFGCLRSELPPAHVE
jgi:hypothetical protein